MRRWCILLIAIAGLAGAGVADRTLFGGTSEDARLAAAQLEHVPAAFGDWTSTELPQEPKVIQRAEATGYVSRVYVNRKKNFSVSVLLLCGPTGPIGAHTPEVCYAGSGFEMYGTPQKNTLELSGASNANYWSGRFEKRGAFEQPLRVGWMWGVDGEWVASSNPRGEFALHGSLYKLYVQHAEPRTPGGTVAKAVDPIQEFLKDFLPEVNKSLTAPAASPKS